MNQRTSLVVMGGGKGNAEFDRRDRDAAPQVGAVGIERAAGLAPFYVMAAPRQFGQQFGGDRVLDHHVVGRDVAIMRAIGVALADLQRVKPGGKGDFLDHAFRRDNALRAAKTAIGGVGLRIGAQWLGTQAHVGIEIGIIGMEQCAVDHGAGQVGRPPAPCRQHHVHGNDPALIGKADIVVNDEIMPLAGHGHVVITVQPHLGRTPGPVGHQGGKAGTGVGLRFLAAKATAHAPDLDRDQIGGTVQHMGDHMLGFGRVLGGRGDMHLPLLTRAGQRDLPFKVEMFLPAHDHAARQPAGRVLKSRLHVAALHFHWPPDQRATGGTGLGHVQDGGQVLIFHLRQTHGAPRRATSGGGNHEHRLAIERDFGGCQQRFVPLAHGADLVVTGNVGGGIDAHHAIHLPHGLKVHGQDPGMGAGAQSRNQMQRAARFGQVINIGGAALDMHGGTFMPQAA